MSLIKSFLQVFLPFNLVYASPVWSDLGGDGVAATNKMSVAIAFKIAL